MEDLDIENSLFKELRENSSTWWTNLKKDKDLTLEIRKENYINVYFNGGALIENLKHNDKDGFSGQIHSKYIPIISTVGKSDYIPFSFLNKKIEFGDIKTMSLDSFEEENVKRIKDNIKKYYSNDSEKGIQYSFINKDPFFIDSEFQYTDKHQDKTIRIDLVRIDPTIKQIVFVEVKTIGDRRLYNEEICDQLKSYNTFIENHYTLILDYYKKVFEIKKSLDILPEGIKSINLDDYSISRKTLLLFGDCEQKWIDTNSPILDAKIKDIAIGCYYFGQPEYNCDIIHKSKRNRHIF